MKLKKIKEIEIEYLNIINNNNNTLLIYKREYLIKLLLKLDAILSDNEELIKCTRKKLVIRINKAIDFIDSEINSKD